MEGTVTLFNGDVIRDRSPTHYITGPPSAIDDAICPHVSARATLLSFLPIFSLTFYCLVIFLPSHFLYLYLFYAPFFFSRCIFFPPSVDTSEAQKRHFNAGNCNISRGVIPLCGLRLDDSGRSDAAAGASKLIRPVAISTPRPAAAAPRGQFPRLTAGAGECGTRWKMSARRCQNTRKRKNKFQVCGGE